MVECPGAAAGSVGRVAGAYQLDLEAVLVLEEGDRQIPVSRVCRVIPQFGPAMRWSLVEQSTHRHTLGNPEGDVVQARSQAGVEHSRHHVG